MAIKIGSLLIALGLDSGEFKSGLTQVEKEFRASTRRIEGMGKAMAGLGAKLSLGVTAPLTALGVSAVKAAMESKDALAQVNATLASMGNVAGRTADQLKELATGEMKKSLYDDDEILRKVTTTLLTFGKVAGETFDRAQAAAIDLSAKFGTDLQSSALMLGKALNDPVKGITALSRAGVSFSPAQKAMIKSLVETGRAAEAQRLILAELERQVGGSAEAARGANPLGALKQSFAEFQEQVGDKLLTMLPTITDAIMRVLDAFNSLSPGVQQAVVVTGLLAAAFGPLLAVIGSVVQIIAPLIAGLKLAAATIAANAAAAQAAGVSYSVLGASLKSLGAVMISLATNPFVLVAAGLAALIGGVYLLTQYTRGSTTATGIYAKAQAEAAKITDTASKAANDLASAHGAARVEALRLAKAEQENIKQKLASARASLVLAQAELARAKSFAAVQDTAAASAGGSVPGATGGVMRMTGQRAVNTATTNVTAQKDTIASLEKSLATVTAAINGATAPAINAPTIAEGGGSGSKSGGGRSRKEKEDRTAEITRRFNDELAGYADQVLSARQSMAASAAEAAEYELRGVEIARLRTLDGIQSDKDYSAAQKQRLALEVEDLAQAQRDQIERDKVARLEREALDLADAKFDALRLDLQSQYEIADTQAERKRLALALLDAEQKHLRAQLEATLASTTIADADKARARIALDALNATAAAVREGVARSNETQAERYVRDLNKTPGQINEALDAIKIDGLEALNDGLVDAIVNFRSLGDVAQSILKQILAQLLQLQIEQLLIKPLAGMMGLGGGAGGFMGFLQTGLGLAGAAFGGASINGVSGSSFASGLDLGAMGAGLKIPGFATGTSFAPGGLALVGERGPELVNLRRGAQVIPNHDLTGLGSSTVHKPTFVFPGVSNAKDAREAAGQAARRYRRELNGPLAKVA